MSTIAWNGHNLATLLEDVPSTITYKNDGFATATLRYQCLWDVAPSLVQYVAQHPDYSWLKRKSATIEREEAHLAIVTFNFEGIDDSAGLEPRNITYSLVSVLREEPITTHPKFPEFAGSVGNPNKLYGAQFVITGDDRGKFLGFSPTVPAVNPDGTLIEGKTRLNPFAGLENFLAVSYVYTVSAEYPGGANIKSLLEGINLVDTPPDSDVLPELPEGRWLYTSCRVTQVGFGHTVEREWTAGYTEWNPLVYDKRYL